MCPATSINMCTAIIHNWLLSHQLPHENSDVSYHHSYFGKIEPKATNLSFALEMASVQGQLPLISDEKATTPTSTGTLLV